MAKNILLSWLNDAYGMEKNLIEVLEKHADDAEDHPEVRSKILEHLELTKQHAEQVKSRIEALGGDVSGLKTTIAKMGGKIGEVASGMAEDAIVKNALAEYTSEHMEIASYQALIAAAESMDDQETVDMAENILSDEIEMAEWLEENLPTVVQGYIAEKEPDKVMV